MKHEKKMDNIPDTKFENTLRDLKDCYYFLYNSNSDDFESMNAREFNSMVRLVDLCNLISFEIKPFPTTVPEDDDNIIMEYIYNSEDKNE